MIPAVRAGGPGVGVGGLASRRVAEGQLGGRGASAIDPRRSVVNVGSRVDIAGIVIAECLAQRRTSLRGVGDSGQVAPRAGDANALGLWW